MEQICAAKPQLPPQLPPSPTGLPFIGHLHLLGKLPHQSLQKLAQHYGDVMLLKLGKVNTLVVSSSGSAKEVLKTKDHNFASRPKTTFAETIGYSGAGLAFANGDHWKSIRKLCMYEVLTAKRVEAFHPIRKAEVSLFMKDLIKHSREKSAVNLSTTISDLTFNVVCTMVLGKNFSATALDDAKDDTVFFKKTLTKAAVMAGLHAGDYLPIPKWMDTQVSAIKEIQQALDKFIQKEVEAHRRKRDPSKPPQDFVDVLLSTNDIRDDTIKALVVDMVGGGTESSAVTVVWAISELIKNPKLMEKAQRELREVVGDKRTLEETDIPKLPFLQAVVKETLRLHPPGPLLIPHESTAECTVGEFTVPAGTRTVVNIYAIARDEDEWEDPLKFDPDRFMGDSSPDLKGQNFEYLPFGSGRRICPGLMLAMATVQFILGSLLHGFDWRLPAGQTAQELDMSEVFGLTVPRAVPLMLVPLPRLEPQAYVDALASNANKSEELVNASPVCPWSNK